MPWKTWIDIDDDPGSNDEIRSLYDRTRNRVSGAVPDLVRLTSRSPEVAGLLHDLSCAVYQTATGLSPREKEIAALITSSYVGCVH